RAARRRGLGRAAAARGAACGNAVREPGRLCRRRAGPDVAARRRAAGRCRVRAPVRDAALATAALLLAIVAGSGFLEHVDPALLGYLGATVVAFAGFTWRASAFWRRRPSAFYARALGA